jgi:hypothetical protein
MTTLQKLSLNSLRILALLSLALIAGTGPLALAQDTVQGKVSLLVGARFGNTILPPGEYHLSVQLLGAKRSVEAIQSVDTPVAVLLISTAKGGPAAGSLAMASRPDPRNPIANDIRPDGSGYKIHSVTLENVGLVIQFVEGSSKGTLHTRAAAPAQVVASAKSSD